MHGNIFNMFMFVGMCMCVEKKVYVLERLWEGGEQGQGDGRTGVRCVCE